MSRAYKNAPLVEAVCEFRLSQDTSWDSTIPGLLYEQLRNEFPNKTARTFQNVQMVASPQGLQQEVRLSEGVMLKSPDGQTIVQIAPHLLAVNSLKPYPGWKRFKPSVERGLHVLREIIPFNNFEAVALRYINRIEIPSHQLDLEQYFEFRPFLGEQLPQSLASFTMGCVVPVHDREDSCSIQFASAVSDLSDQATFLLIFDFFPAKPRTVSATVALDWVERAHSRIDEIFEGCITDSLRKIFDGGQ